MSARLLEQVAGFLHDDEWFPDELPDGVLACGFSGDSGTWAMYVVTDVDDERVVVYSVAPVRPAPERRADMADFVNRCNFRTVIGNFEMDADDGELRFRTSMDVEGVEHVTELFRQLLYANVAAMDQYLPGILAVAEGRATPAAAHASCIA